MNGSPNGNPPPTLHDGKKIISQAARDVLTERARQINEEGWTPQHDDRHINSEMAGAAASYALHDIAGGFFKNDIRSIWPWSREWFKPSGKRRNLVKAAALIIAEIERLDRVKEKP